MTANDFVRVAALYGAMQVRSVSCLQKLQTLGLKKSSAGHILQRAKAMLNERVCDAFGKTVVRDIEDLLTYLYETSGAPLALVHGDLWDKNIIKASDQQYVIIDWERAKIDVPFAEILLMARGVSRLKRSADDARTIERGLNDYFEQWKRYGAVEELNKIGRAAHLKDDLLQVVHDYEYRKNKQLDVLIHEDVEQLRDTVREIGRFCGAIRQAASI